MSRSRHSDGVAIRDDVDGVWTGTFVDATHAAALSECWQMAEEISGLSTRQLQEHGAEIVEVKLLEVRPCAAV